MGHFPLKTTKSSSDIKKYIVCTRNVYPPIPIRSFDWCAWWDGIDEGENAGWGTTEEDTIKDLVENHATPALVIPAKIEL